MPSGARPKRSRAAFDDGDDDGVVIAQASASLRGESVSTRARGAARLHVDSPAGQFS